MILKKCSTQGKRLDSSNHSPPRSGEAAAVASEDPSAWGSAHEAMSSPEPELSEDDFICSICLEPMYKPLGLTCGHKCVHLWDVQ